MNNNPDTFWPNYWLQFLLSFKHKMHDDKRFAMTSRAKTCKEILVEGLDFLKMRSKFLSGPSTFGGVPTSMHQSPLT